MICVKNTNMKKYNNTRVVYVLGFKLRLSGNSIGEALLIMSTSSASGRHSDTVLFSKKTQNPYQTYCFTYSDQ